MTVRAAHIVCALAISATPAFAADYYVRPGGNDAAGGTSPSSAWQTPARVNQARLLDGDRVLFEGGATFPGNLVLDTSDGGTATSPITFTSFGAGRAVIEANSGDALVVSNRAAARVTGLAFRGTSAPGTSGIVFYTDLPGSSALSFVRIEDVEISGFGDHGIEIGAWSGAPGFSDVRIVRASVHDNGRTGLLTYADRPRVHRGVYVGHTRAYSNPGLAAATTNTGSGIVLGSVHGGTVEWSVAHDNGSRSAAREGPVGIWAYDSSYILIQHNESYRNRTAGPADGGGFDLDQNVSDSIVQFNYSHENDGAGYLIAHAMATDGHRNNIVRFNISQDDARKNGYGAIEVWGRTVNTAIYHNTIVTSGTAGAVPAAVRVHNSGVPGVRATGLRVLNNIFYTRGTAALVRMSTDQLSAAPAVFAGNSYFGTSAFTIAWGSATVSSLTAFRAAGQEQIGSTATGRSGDPGLVAAGSGGTFDDATRLQTLEAYRLLPTSTVRDGGVSLTTFGLSAGATDYFGVAVAGVVPDIGASEYVAAPPPETGSRDIVIWAANAPVLHGNWAVVPDANAAGFARTHNADRGAPKVTAAAAAPAHYFEQSFTAEAGVAYRLWIRAIAERNSYNNDSVYVQFSGSVTAGGSPVYRIGTTSATSVVLEDCSGCGVSGWGWQDNGYGTGVLGPAVYFAATGRQTIRIQSREDGIGIDQIVLSPVTYAVKAPGATKNDTAILPMTGGPTPPPVSEDGDEIVLWAGDASRVSGNWQLTADATAAGSARLANVNHNVPKLTTALAVPSDFFELRFNAIAGVPYRLWLRAKAQNNSYTNDSVFVQFSGSVNATGTPTARIGTTSAVAVVLEDCSGCGVAGWGWQDTGYGSGVLGPVIYFASTGPQTLRIQAREDGMSIDQVVLSSSRYLTTAPGAVKNDTTILIR